MFYTLGGKKKSEKDLTNAPSVQLSDVSSGAAVRPVPAGIRLKLSGQ